MRRRITACRGVSGSFRAAVCSSLALALALPAEAIAQERTFYLDRLDVAGAPDDAIGLWRPELRPKTRFYGQLGLGFALNPLRVENHIDDAGDAAILNDAGGAAVSTQLIAYADVGVELLERFAFGIELPVIAVQTGHPTSAPGIDAPSNVDLAPAALMDLRLDARVVLFRTPSRTFKLGMNGAVWVPTGNEYAFGGDRTASGAIGLGAEIDLRKVFFVLNTGPHFRPMSDLNDLVISDEWKLGIGAFVPLRDGTIRVGGEVFGSTGIADGTTFDADNTPLEWMVEGRFATDAAKRGYVGVGGGTRMTAGYAPDFRVAAVAGYSFGIEDTVASSPSRRFRAYADHGADTDKDGLPDDVDLCPNDPEDGKPPNTDDGCPSLPDRDGDGFPDISDRCPDQPEDFDGVRDGDGCPEDDGDLDGIPDARDNCPETPGDPSPIPGKNGCARYIIKGDGVIQLLQQVQFETGRSTILPGSYPILDEVVRVLVVNPEIVDVQIEGHTDNRGPDDLNERLSNDRAHSVMQYLIAHKIEAGRLSARGFGPKRPIADNGTVDGRQKNRRVEFHLRTRGTGPSGAPRRR